MKLFALDSPFQKYGTIVFDMIALNIFWFMTTFFTFGLLMPLSNASLFHSVHHCIGEGEGYITRTYFSTFKTKFLKSLGLTAFALFAYGLTVFNIWTVWSGQIDLPYLLPLYLMLFLEVSMTLLFAYALLGETDMNVKQLIKFGFLLSNRHLLTSILCMILIFVVAVLIYTMAFMPIIFLVSPTFFVMTRLIHKRAFSKYYLDKLV